MVGMYWPNTGISGYLPCDHQIRLSQMAVAIVSQTVLCGLFVLGSVSLEKILIDLIIYNNNTYFLQKNLFQVK